MNKLIVSPILFAAISASVFIGSSAVSAHGMMDSGMVEFGSMMGYGGFSNIHGLLAGATWIALIIFLLTGAYFFIKQSHKERKEKE